MRTDLLKNTIKKYRDDADLQNFIDWIQAEWVSDCSDISRPHSADSCNAVSTVKQRVPFLPRVCSAKPGNSYGSRQSISLSHCIV